ncbi:unnamed protein product, partial [Closterium sp. Naga37s-1]
MRNQLEEPSPLSPAEFDPTAHAHQGKRRLNRGAERASADGGARQSAEGDVDGGKRPRKRRWDGGKGGDARAVTAADDALAMMSGAPMSGAPMAAREGGGLAAGGADGSSGGADGSSDNADGSSDDADVERIESGGCGGCIAVERWRLHCKKKSEKAERRAKRRARVKESAAARRGVGVGVAAAPPGAGGAVSSGIISSGGSGGGGVSVEELGAEFGPRAGALVARAALPHILAGTNVLMTSANKFPNAASFLLPHLHTLLHRTPPLLQASGDAPVEILFLAVSNCSRFVSQVQSLIAKRFKLQQCGEWRGDGAGHAARVDAQILKMRKEGGQLRMLPCQVMACPYKNINDYLERHASLGPQLQHVMLLVLSEPEALRRRTMDYIISFLPPQRQTIILTSGSKPK